MEPNDQADQSINLSGMPLKRKRGRPRKDPSLKHTGGAHIPPGFELAQQHLPQITPVRTETVVGQTVNGVIDASFDGGYLLSVRIGNSNTNLRGVIFKPGHYVPVTTENDIAPHVQMIQREGGFFSSETQSSSRGQKLAVQRAGTKRKYNHTQSNALPVMIQSGSIDFGSHIVENDDKDVHMVEPISMLPPDKTIPVGQLFVAQQSQSNHQIVQGIDHEDNGSLNDGTNSESKSKPVTSASNDTSGSSQMSDVNLENGMEGSKSSGDDSGIVVSNQETGNIDVPNDSGIVLNQEIGNGNMQFSTESLQSVPVTASFMNFGTGRMTELLQAVQENVKDAQVLGPEQPTSVSNVEFRETMASGTGQQHNASAP